VLHFLANGAKWAGEGERHADLDGVYGTGDARESRCGESGGDEAATGDAGHCWGPPLFGTSAFPVAAEAMADGGLVQCRVELVKPMSIVGAYRPPYVTLAKARAQGTRTEQGTWMKQPCVYILASQRNGTLYIGVTSDVVRRVWQHR